LKLAERSQARDLRVQGWPHKRIAALLGVSPGSVHAWTRDIELTAEQRAHNLRGPTGPQNPAVVARRAESWSATCRAKRAAYQAEGRTRALAGGDPLHLQGCMLYWAEGSKGRNVIDFANSDVAMVVTFCRFMRESLGVEQDRIRLSINAYTNNGLSIDDIEAHWLTALGLPRSCVRKHVVNHTPTSSSGRAKNRLVYGVCSLRVGSTQALQHIYGAIQEYAGFDEPRWLG
jgi:hypothetical protein